MLAILGGAGAALAWGIGLVCSAQSTRRIGSAVTLAWVMTIGLALIVPPLAVSRTPSFDVSISLWLVAGGVGEFAGMMLTYLALRRGLVGVVGPIVSAEGAVAAVVAIGAGEPVAAGQGLALAVVATGVVLIARTPNGDRGHRRAASTHGRGPILLAVGAAVSFGIALYGIGRAGAHVPLVWAVLPPRLIGVLALALPLAARGSLRLTRETAPYAAAAAACDVLGFYAYAWGARHELAITAVLATLGGAVAAVVSRAVLAERLSPTQIAGAAAIVVGVAALTAIST
jgi:drug/metabolite transporter (DMT)-like permease